MKRTLLLLALMPIYIGVYAYDLSNPIYANHSLLPEAFHSPNDTEDEYEYVDKYSDEHHYYNHEVSVGGPIVTTSSASQSIAIYRSSELNMQNNDKIARLRYRGYNPGEEVMRHVIVWVQNVSAILGRLDDDVFPMGEQIKVFEGDITIKHCEQTDEQTELFDIPFEDPFVYKGEDLKITVLSYGEPSEQDVLFDRSESARWSANYSIADNESGELSEPIWDQKSNFTFTVAKKVEYLTGKVSDQDGNPISGAEVTLASCLWEEKFYSALTDGEGLYRVRVTDGNNSFRPLVKAAGFPPYIENVYEYSFHEIEDEWDFWTQRFYNNEMNFTLYNALDFKAGVAGTIILPVTPDASLGKYYRLDRRIVKTFVFVREKSPKANVPYILVADKDCRVDISGMDLSITPGVTDIGDSWFIGQYDNSNFLYTTNQELIFIDTTPDFCGLGHVGGCRAYVLVDVFDLFPPFYYSLEEDDGVEQVTGDNDVSGEWYDLRGIRLAEKPSTAGIYIVRYTDGTAKKIVVR